MYNKIAGIFTGVTLTVFLMCISCSPLQHLHKVQSDNRISKTEELNFSSEKSMTQWWYFDCFFDDGSVLVFLFAPNQWWSEAERMPSHKSLFYLSYMDAKGELKIKNKAFDAKEVIYDKNSIKCPYFELFRAHDKESRNYKVNFFLDEVKGTVNVKSVTKAFSPFPTGAMGRLVSKYILKMKGEKPSFRYASHVPQGQVTCNLGIGDTSLQLSGKVYHEQGRFNGLPHQMGEGWSWFHFVSKDFNIFGTPEEFFCLEKNGKRLLGGLNILDKGCVLSDKTYKDESIKLVMGGNLTFNSKKLSFEISPTEKSTALICIPSVDTEQLWGTVAQPSLIRFTYKGKEFQEKGWMLLETCRMGKKIINPVMAESKK